MAMDIFMTSCILKFQLSKKFLRTYPIGTTVFGHKEDSSFFELFLVKTQSSKFPSEIWMYFPRGCISRKLPIMQTIAPKSEIQKPECWCPNLLVACPWNFVK